MTTKKVVQCAKERKLLVKEILKNQSIEIGGKTFTVKHCNPSTLIELISLYG